MARILKLSKRAAYTFSKQISNADPQRDIKTVMRFRRLSRRFREFMGDYHSLMEEYAKQHDNSLIESSSQEQRDNIALLFNKQCYDLSHTKGLEPCSLDSENADGIILENDDFTFLKDKFYGGLKGIPTEGELGDIWEEIYSAFEDAKDVKLQVVKDKEAAG